MSSSARRLAKRKQKRAERKAAEIKDPSKKRAQPQQTFQDLVAGATLAKLGGYIDENIKILGQRLTAQQKNMLQTLYTRVLSLEEILVEKLGLTKEDLSARVSTIEDRAEGYELVNGAVEKGDRVRLNIRTKAKDQADWQGASRLQVDNTGSGNTLGELEAALLGMSANEVKETAFGQDGEMLAELSINRVSRRPKKEEPKTEEAAPAEATAETTENANATDSNAG